MKILEENEIVDVQARIHALPKGVYEVSEIFGDDWKNIGNPHSYGRRFMQTVTQGLLRRIRYHDRLLDNHRTYEIGK